MQNSFKFHEILNKVVMETFRHIFASQKLSTVTLSVFLEYFGRFIRSLSVPVINRIESKDFFQVIERF